MPETTLPPHPSSVEHEDLVTQLPSIRDTSSLLSDDQNGKPPDAQLASETGPTPEQQMAFLQYLIHRGLINEGFEDGKIPEQYRKKTLE
jgi:hypothetical protein